MIVYTGCFHNYNKYPGPCFSIAGKTPGWFVGDVLQFLAPHYHWWKYWKDNHMSFDWYIDKYIETVLKPLVSPEALMKKLEERAPNAKSIVLCCYEASPKPIDKELPDFLEHEYCHRHIISAWLRKGGYDSREAAL